MHETTLRVSQLAQRQMGTHLPGFGHRNPLRTIDARVAAERIGHETGDGKIFQVIGAKQLHPIMVLYIPGTSVWNWGRTTVSI